MSTKFPGALVNERRLAAAQRASFGLGPYEWGEHLGGKFRPIGRSRPTNPHTSSNASVRPHRNSSRDSNATPSFYMATTTPKAQLTIRLDQNVVEWFHGLGRGYQIQINPALKAALTMRQPGEANEPHATG